MLSFAFLEPEDLSSVYIDSFFIGFWLLKIHDVEVLMVQIYLLAVNTPANFDFYLFLKNFQYFFKSYSKIWTIRV